MGTSARWQVIRQWRDVVSLGWWQMTTVTLCPAVRVWIAGSRRGNRVRQWVFSTSEAEGFAADSRNNKP